MKIVSEVIRDIEELITNVNTDTEIQEIEEEIGRVATTLFGLAGRVTDPDSLVVLSGSSATTAKEYEDKLSGKETEIESLERRVETLNNRIEEKKNAVGRAREIIPETVLRRYQECDVEGEYSGLSEEKWVRSVEHDEDSITVTFDKSFGDITNYGQQIKEDSTSE
jgi:prefoldin subunit 5